MYSGNNRLSTEHDDNGYGNHRSRPHRGV